MSRKVKTNVQPAQQESAPTGEQFSDISDGGFTTYVEDVDSVADSASEICQPDESLAPPPKVEEDSATLVKFSEIDLMRAVTTGGSAVVETASQMAEFDPANAKIEATVKAVFDAVKDASSRARLVGWTTSHKSLANLATLSGSFLCATGETLCTLKNQQEGQSADAYAFTVLCHALGDHLRVLSAPSLSDANFAKKYNVSSSALLGAVVLCECDWSKPAWTVIKQASTKIGVYGSCAFSCVDAFEKALSSKKIAKSSITAKAFDSTLANSFNSFSLDDPCDSRICAIIATYFGALYVSSSKFKVTDIMASFNIGAISTRLGELTKNEITVQDLDNEFMSALSEGWGGATDYRINVCLSMIFRSQVFTKYLGGMLKKLASYIGDPVGQASLLKELKITHVIGVDGNFHKALSDSDDVFKDYPLMDPFLKLDGFSGGNVSAAQKTLMAGVFSEQPELASEMREFITSHVCTSKTVAVLDPETRSAHNCACQIARGAYSYETLKTGLEAAGVKIDTDKITNSLGDCISTVFGLSSKKYATADYTSLLAKADYDSEIIYAVTGSTSAPVIRQFVTGAKALKQISFSCIGIKGWAKLNNDLYSKKVCALGGFGGLSQSSNVSQSILHCVRGDGFAVDPMNANSQLGALVACSASPLNESYYSSSFYLRAGVVTCSPKRDDMSMCISYWQGRGSRPSNTAKAVLGALSPWINSPQSMSNVPKSAFVEAEVQALRGLAGTVSYSKKGSVGAPNSSAAVRFVAKQHTGYLVNLAFAPAQQLACAATIRVQEGGNLTGNDSMTFGNERFFGLDLNVAASREKALSSKGTCAGFAVLISSSVVGIATGSKGVVSTRIL